MALPIPQTALRLVSVIALATLPQSVIASENPNSEGGAIPASSAWQVELAEYECRLAQSYDDGNRTYVLQFDRSTADRRFSIMFAGPELPRTRRSITGRLRLIPQNIDAESVARMGRLPGRPGQILVIERLPNALLSQFHDVQILEISADDMDPVRLALAGVRAAIEGLHNCTDDLLAGWGIDVESLNALRTLPQPIGDPGRWITVHDYPVAAAVQGVGGIVVVRLDVSASGEVENCTIVESSGYRPLDSRTCRRLSSRARFEPAIDADGLPTPAPWVNSIRYWTQ